jgi:hypothetical protein
MSIFAKKLDSEQKSDQKVTGDLSAGAAPVVGASRTGYGIGEAIQLLRGLPVDQNPDLVVRVVRATLASLNVHLSDIIEDASKKQKATQDRIAGEHTKVADLEKQLADHRKEIAMLEADLKETTTVKDRLLLAEKSAGGPPTPLRGIPAPGPHTTTLLGGGKGADEATAKD